MPDPHFPSVDLDFIESLIIKSDKIIPESKIKVGDTTIYVLKGEKALHKRKILIRELEQGQVVCEQATGLAIRLGFMGELLRWYEQNRNWKDGAFTLTDSVSKN